MIYFLNLLSGPILKRKYMLKDMDGFFIKEELFNLLGLIEYLKLDR